MKTYKVSIDLTLTLDSENSERATHMVERKLLLFLKGMGVSYKYVRVREVKRD